MDDNAVGREQARQVRRAIQQAGIEVGRLWVHYFSIGGDAGELEIDAFLHHSLTLPGLERDLLSHAANELIDQQHPPPRAPYGSDLVDHGEQAPPTHDQPDHEDPDSRDGP